MKLVYIRNDLQAVMGSKESKKRSIEQFKIDFIAHHNLKFKHKKADVEL